MEIKTMFEVHGTLLFLWSSQRRIFKKLNPDHFSTVCLYVRPADPQCGKKNIDVQAKNTERHTVQPKEKETGSTTLL